MMEYTGTGRIKRTFLQEEGKGRSGKGFQVKGSVNTFTSLNARQYLSKYFVLFRKDVAKIAGK